MRAVFVLSGVGPDQSREDKGQEERPALKMLDGVRSAEHTRWTSPTTHGRLGLVYGISKQDPG